jgi:hypothetical protein
MSRLRRLLLNNWYFKLLSLGLAYVLWLGVAHAPMAEVRVAVPLELRNLPARLEVVSDVPVHVQVTLQGSEKLLRDLHYEELMAVIWPASEPAIIPTDSRRTMSACPPGSAWSGSVRPICTWTCSRAQNHNAQKRWTWQPMKSVWCGNTWSATAG